MVDITILGIETQHAGKIFEGSGEDLKQYMRNVGYRKTAKVGHDTFL